MTKKLFAYLASTLLLGMLVSCSSGESGGSTTTPSSGTTAPSLGVSSSNTSAYTLKKSDNPVELMVVTSYGGSDGNRHTYEEAYEDFQIATGHTVLDDSESSSDAWKQSVRMDFQTGAEPDVLFFFTGIDADPLIEGERVMSLREIREVYPEYGSNMQDEMIPSSTFDGDKYVIPVNGYWEGLYVNKSVLLESGVTIPDEFYTWEQFLIDCETIKEAGFTPIAASLKEEPHYWFEFSILNNGSLENHLNTPKRVGDETCNTWVSALDDIKFLYDAGYFPEDTFQVGADVTTQMMADNMAAFQIDGSWKINWFKDYADSDNFLVTNVPAKGERLGTEIIGGISMGYYITRTAWEDPKRQEAAVDFVKAMTSDEVIATFGAVNITALKIPMGVTGSLSALERSALTMKESVTGLVEATQDGLPDEERINLFNGIQAVVEGNQTAEYILQEALKLN